MLPVTGGLGQCLPFILAGCCQTVLIVLPSDALAALGSLSDGQPSGASLHALSPSATHTPVITGGRRELLPRVLTLTLLYILRRLFSSALRYSREYFPLGSRVSCGAPTFLRFGVWLPIHAKSATDRPTHVLTLFWGAKVSKKVQLYTM